MFGLSGLILSISIRSFVSFLKILWKLSGLFTLLDYFTLLGPLSEGGVIVRQTSICVQVSLGQISVFSIICQSRFDLVPVYGYIDYDSRGACFKLKLVPR